LKLIYITEADFNSLRSSLKKNNGTHSLKALDHFEASMPIESIEEVAYTFGSHSLVDTDVCTQEPIIVNTKPLDDFADDLHLPVIPNVSKAGDARRALQSTVVQQSYPTVMDPTMGSGGYQPETEAEVVMHDLWLARRRQEVC
jgi:hypothetical protein